MLFDLGFFFVCVSFAYFGLPWLVAQTVKRLPAMRETGVQSLGREDLLEKEMATHTTILTWKIPWTEEPGRLQSMGWQRVRTRLSDFTFTCLFFCWTILLKFVVNSLFIRYLSIYALSSEMSY